MNGQRWNLVRESDGTLFVASQQPGVLGAARLEFADGSFVDVDPQRPDQLLALSAAPTDTGAWLLGVFTDDEFVNDYLSGKIPASCLTDAPSATNEALALGRAAMMSHLALYDSPRRRGVWQLEILAVLAGIGNTGKYPLAHLPADLDVDQSMLALDPGAVPPDERVVDMLHQASMLRLVPGELRQYLRTTEVRLRTPVDDVEVESRLLAYESDFLLEDSFLGGPSALIEHNGEPIYLAPWEELRSLLITDRSWLPGDLDLSFRAFSHVTRSGGRCRITVGGVTKPSDTPLFVRLFDPAPADDSSTVIRHIAPLRFDGDRQVYTAEFDIMPYDLESGSGRLAVDVIDGKGGERDDELQPAIGRRSYWLAALRSDVAVHHLMSLEPALFGADDLARCRARIDDSARRADLTIQELGVIALAKDFVDVVVTPVVLPTKS